MDEVVGFCSIIEKEVVECVCNIVGLVMDVKENVDYYEKTVRVMKNIVDGYGNCYLILLDMVVDSLVLDYDYISVGRELKGIFNKIRLMVKFGKVCDCDYVEENWR